MTSVDPCHMKSLVSSIFVTKLVSDWLYNEETNEVRSLGTFYLFLKRN